jgi:hypothetical protein
VGCVGSGLCDELIAVQESPTVWVKIVCELAAMKLPRFRLGFSITGGVGVEWLLPEGNAVGSQNAAI